MTIEFGPQLNENTNSIHVKVDLPEPVSIALSDNIKNGHQQIHNLQHGDLLTSQLKLKPPKPTPILIKHSSLKSDSNPLTICRKAKIKKGESLTVHWDEEVAVYKVKYYDPCGATIPDYFSVECVSKSIKIAKKHHKCDKSDYKKYYSFFSSKKKPTKKKKKDTKMAAFVFVVGVVVFICI